MGDSIVQAIDFLRPMRCVVRNHHERIDGTGYPDGLAGQAIPWRRAWSRCRCYDAMTSQRAYGEA